MRKAYPQPIQIVVDSLELKLQIKAHAALQNMSLTEWTSQALREALEREQRQEQKAV
jgi:predicted HicB family RNase H-like nuclease